MTTDHDSPNDQVSQEELDKLDANLLEVEILYKSRCVQAPQGKNVTVREIEKKDEIVINHGK